MENKVLIKLIVPELDTSFDVFIPVNEFIWRIKKLLMKSVSDLTNTPFSNQLDFVLINKEDSTLYRDNDLIINTDIRNGSELIFLSKR